MRVLGCMFAFVPTRYNPNYILEWEFILITALYTLMYKTPVSNIYVFNFMQCMVNTV
jgi:hypothetical protein